MTNPLIIIRPQDISLKVNEFSEKIISGIMSNPEIDIVGLSNGIFLACSAVNMASDIANVNINEIALGYIEVPILGKFEAVFIRVGSTPELNRGKRAKEEEKDMNLSTEREGQLITIRRQEQLDRVLTLCLIKLQRVEKLKIIAAASAINDAVSLALKLTEGRVAKYPIAITLVDLYSLPARDDPLKKMTGVSIFLEKNHDTQRSPWFEDLTKRLKKLPRL